MCEACNREPCECCPECGLVDCVCRDPYAFDPPAEDFTIHFRGHMAAECRDHVRVLQNTFGLGYYRHSEIGVECQLLEIIGRARFEAESVSKILFDAEYVEGLS